MKNKSVTEKLWNEHSSYIRKLCDYKLKSTPHLVDDCVQEVFLALIEAIEKDTDIAYPKAWLTQVAVNKINDIYKQENKRRENTIPFKDEHITAYTTIDEEIDEKKIEENLEKILSSLTEQEKLLLDNFYTKKIKQKEMAQELKISENALRQQLFRLKRKIINEIKKLI